jgi:hypothetical protein
MSHPNAVGSALFLIMSGPGPPEARYQRPSGLSIQLCRAAGQQDYCLNNCRNVYSTQVCACTQQGRAILLPQIT